MQTLLKQEFTRRISEANRTQLVEILYDICFAYLQEAKKAHEADKREAFKDALRSAQQTVGQLMKSLDFTYPISKELYSLYRFAQERMAAAMYQYQTGPICEAERTLEPLKEAFAQLARTDTSAPMMSNTQKVYAGMTYGRGNLAENYSVDPSRGYLV